MVWFWIFTALRAVLALILFYMSFAFFMMRDAESDKSSGNRMLFVTWVFLALALIISWSVVADTYRYMDIEYRPDTVKAEPAGPVAGSGHLTVGGGKEDNGNTGDASETAKAESVKPAAGSRPLTEEAREEGNMGGHVEAAEKDNENPGDGGEIVKDESNPDTAKTGTSSWFSQVQATCRRWWTSLKARIL